MQFAASPSRHAAIAFALFAAVWLAIAVIVAAPHIGTGTSPMSRAQRLRRIKAMSANATTTTGGGSGGAGGAP